MASAHLDQPGQWAARSGTRAGQKAPQDRSSAGRSLRSSSSAAAACGIWRKPSQHARAARPGAGARQDSFQARARQTFKKPAGKAPHRKEQLYCCHSGATIPCVPKAASRLVFMHVLQL